MSFFPKEILEKCYVVFVQSEFHTQLNTNIERYVAIVREEWRRVLVSLAC